MLKKSMLYSVLTLAFAGIIVLAFGFYEALLTSTLPGSLSPVAAAVAQPSSEAPEAQPSSEGLLPQPAENSAPSTKDPNSYKLLFLGDSLAKGTGDETGKGFSGDLSEALKNTTSKEIVVDNQAVDGLESAGLLEQLHCQRFDKNIADSDLIFISIGGNDVRKILSLNTLQKEDAFKTRLDSYMNRLKLSLQELRKTNPKATIVFLGLYNPYEKADTPDDVRLLNTWNYNSQQLVEADGKAIFIPTHDLVKYNLGKYIAPDGMHPNSVGYQALSNRISQSVAPIIQK